MKVCQVLIDYGAILPRSPSIVHAGLPCRKFRRGHYVPLSPFALLPLRRHNGGGSCQIMTEFSTPLMRQYSAIKQRHPNALLLFRLGDFYELFYEDAVTAARELEITLTSRNKEKGQAIPMCGVPYHAAEGYIARLIQKGYRVAICDQVEDPAVAKKLVKREVTRIVTPGTATDAHLLRSHENNYLAAVARSGQRSGVAHVDISTGEFRVTEVDAAEVAGALEHLAAREVLFPA